MSDPTTVQTTVAPEQPAPPAVPEVKPVLETSNEAPQEATTETKETAKADTVEETSATDATPQSNMLATKATPAEGEKKGPTVTTTPVTTAADTKKVTDEDKEPQNTLTERFTRAEWDALKKFRDAHIITGTLFIISQAKSQPPASMGGGAATTPKEGHAIGTGGNPVSTLLKAGRDATRRTMLAD